MTAEVQNAYISEVLPALKRLASPLDIAISPHGGSVHPAMHRVINQYGPDYRILSPNQRTDLLTVIGSYYEDLSTFLCVKLTMPEKQAGQVVAHAIAYIDETLNSTEYIRPQTTEGEELSFCAFVKAQIFYQAIKEKISQYKSISHEDIRMAIRYLRPHLGRVLQQVYLEDKSPREICEIEDLSSFGFRNRVNKAFIALQQRMLSETPVMPDKVSKVKTPRVRTPKTQHYPPQPEQLMAPAKKLTHSLCGSLSQLSDIQFRTIMYFLTDTKGPDMDSDELTVFLQHIYSGQQVVQGISVRGSQIPLEEYLVRISQKILRYIGHIRDKDLYEMISTTFGHKGN